MATRVALNSILENLQTVLEGANTTTGSPIDLSSDMSARVKSVYKTHPLKIPPQASVYPFVTCYVTNKAMTDQTMGKGQSNIKRRGIVSIDVVGAVWNDTFARTDEDPADLDIHFLMENIEMILRSNENLTSSVTWQMVDGVQYYDQSLDETAHLRAGILSLKATVYY